MAFNLSESRIDPNVFAALFAPVTRALFAWERLLGERWPVTLQAVTDPAQLGALHVPWYRHAGVDAGVGYRHPDAVALRVRDIGQALEWLPSARAAALQRLATQMREHGYPQVLTAPAASLPDGRAVLLDGVHHAGAVALAGVPFRIALFVVHPPDAQGVADLAVLERNGQPDLDTSSCTSASLASTVAEITNG